MKHLNAYAAGFFDGEGTVYAASRDGAKFKRPSPTVMVTISNCDVRPLNIFKDKWGGSIHTTAAKSRRKELHQWSLASKDAKGFLQDIMPYLVIKKEVAQVAIEFRTLMETPHRERVDYSQRVYRNGRYWVSPSVRPEFREKAEALWQKIRDLNSARVPWNEKRQYATSNSPVPNQDP